MKTRLLLSALLGSTLLSSAAGAASLRGIVVLNAPVVRLSDLFDGISGDADHVLGPAPPPGGQIVVESRQLTFIAGRYGVDWQAASSADRVVLSHPGRPLPRDTVVRAVRAALAPSAGSNDIEIEVPGFNPPMVSPEAVVQPVVEQLDYDPASGRFTALIGLAADGMAPEHIRVAGHAWTTMEIPVATRQLPPGAVVGPDDMHLARVRVGRLRNDVAMTLADAVGKELRRPTVPGQPVPLADLSRQPMVAKGARVTMTLSSGTLSVTAQGRALDEGGMGEHIRVLNPITRAVVDAEVIAAGAVRIEPGSSPDFPDRNNAYDGNGSQVAYR